MIVIGPVFFVIAVLLVRAMFSGATAQAEKRQNEDIAARIAAVNAKYGRTDAYALPGPYGQVLIMLPPVAGQPASTPTSAV